MIKIATSNAQKLAVRKYRDKTYDTIGFDVPKGKREEYKNKAINLGLSLAKFLFLAAESYKPNPDAKSIPLKKEKSESLSADDRQLIEEFHRLPIDAQKYFLKAFKAINQ